MPRTHLRACDSGARWIEHAAADARIVRLLGKTSKAPREHDAREGDYPYTPHDNISTPYEPSAPRHAGASRTLAVAYARGGGLSGVA